MTMFGKNKQRPTSVGGFSVGQIAQHKLDGVKVVITGFDEDEYGPLACCSFSSRPGDGADFYVAELQTLRAAAPEEPTP